ncbi:MULTISPECIES: transposase [Streptomyces]|uniref:transposase n=1 Tax=Streptomyces TaxID=1883 RepID=UPI0018DF052A
MSRCQQGSQRWGKAAARVSRVHQQITVRRASFLHGLSKKLATGFTHVAIEDLNLTALTASAKGTRDKPGRNVKVKARLNRHLLDAGLGSLRKKLEYKTAWYGSQLVVLDQGEPVASTCAKCKERNPSSDPSRSKFHSHSCGAVVHRHENSTASIVDAARRKLTTVASDRGDPKRSPSRRKPRSPQRPRAGGVETRRHRLTPVPPPESDPRASQTTNAPGQLPTEGPRPFSRRPLRAWDDPCSGRSTACRGSETCP